MVSRGKQSPRTYRASWSACKDKLCCIDMVFLMKSRAGCVEKAPVSPSASSVHWHPSGFKSAHGPNSNTCSQARSETPTATLKKGSSLFFASPDDATRILWPDNRLHTSDERVNAAKREVQMLKIGSKQTPNECCLLGKVMSSCHRAWVRAAFGLWWVNCTTSS